MRKGFVVRFVLLFNSWFFDHAFLIIPRVVLLGSVFCFPHYKSQYTKTCPVAFLPLFLSFHSFGYRSFSYSFLRTWWSHLP